MDTLIVCAGGIGDQILGIQCAIAAKRQQPNLEVEVLACARDEVYEPLNFLFGDIVHLNQHPAKEKWGENNWILFNQNEFNKWPHKNKYYVVPDLLFHHPFSFDYNRFNLHPSTIRETRCIPHKRKRIEKIIYAALNTSTPQYVYHHTPELLRALATCLPDYLIYFNNLTSWAGHAINNGDFSNLPDNVLVAENEPFIESLDYLLRSEYCVCLDNGISHITYQLGIPRLLISSRISDLNGLPWVARWYPNLSDCISYAPNAWNIASIVETNIKIPATTLIPRDLIQRIPAASFGESPWRHILGFKF